MEEDQNDSDIDKNSNNEEIKSVGVSFSFFMQVHV